ncbi:MAG: hypothetical protein ABSG44_21635 [Thermodesulfobacteriota bacterium]
MNLEGHYKKDTDAQLEQTKELFEKRLQAEFSQSLSDHLWEVVNEIHRRWKERDISLMEKMSQVSIPRGYKQHWSEKKIRRKILWEEEACTKGREGQTIFSRGLTVEEQRDNFKEELNQNYGSLYSMYRKGAIKNNEERIKEITEALPHTISGLVRDRKKEIYKRKTFLKNIDIEIEKYIIFRYYESFLKYKMCEKILEERKAFKEAVEVISESKGVEIPIETVIQLAVPKGKETKDGELG